MNRSLPSPDAPLHAILERLTPPVHVLDPDASLADLASAFAEDGRSLTAYLVATRRLEGVVPFRTLRRAIHPRHGARFPGLAGLAQRMWATPADAALRDVARAIPAATLDTRICDALFHMDLHHLSDLPIVDRRGELVLELTHGAHARILDDLLGQAHRSRRRAAEPLPRSFDRVAIGGADAQGKDQNEIEKEQAGPSGPAGVSRISSGGRSRG